MRFKTNDFFLSCLKKKGNLGVDWGQICVFNKKKLTSCHLLSQIFIINCFLVEVEGFCLQQTHPCLLAILYLFYLLIIIFFIPTHGMIYILVVNPLPLSFFSNLLVSL